MTLFACCGSLGRGLSRWKWSQTYFRDPLDGIVTWKTFPSCSSWTNKLITAKDHRSVQINVGHIDENGLYIGSFSTFALCGQVRAKVREQ